MPPKEKYTDPELRDEVKEEIHKGDKGGAPGQWSARKAQMMASEYKKRGGGVSGYSGLSVVIIFVFLFWSMKSVRVVLDWRIEAIL